MVGHLTQRKDMNLFCIFKAAIKKERENKGPYILVSSRCSIFDIFFSLFFCASSFLTCSKIKYFISRHVKLDSQIFMLTIIKKIT